VAVQRLLNKFPDPPNRDNTEYAVVIDPTLAYSTFLGGEARYGWVFDHHDESSSGIAVDSPEKCLRGRTNRIDAIPYYYRSLSMPIVLFRFGYSCLSQILFLPRFFF
jgi:hypothetical protein